LAALLSGISLKAFISKERLALIESDIKTISYGFFAPLFFIWIGAAINIKYLIAYPLFIILIIIISSGAKILDSFLVARKELGVRNFVLLGIGLSVRFSMSIVVAKILFESNLINSDLYSAAIASSAIFIFIVPVLFSSLLSKTKYQQL